MMNVLTSRSSNLPSAGERISIRRFHPHPLNPRVDFGNARDLAESIREHGGHPFNPILVRPYSGEYEIVSGHTRFIALTQHLGCTTLEVGLDIVVREMDEQTAIRLMVDENVKRWQYNPAEFAEGLKLLVNNCGLSLREVSRRYCVDHSWLLRVLKVAELPDRVKSRVVWGKTKLSKGVTGDLPHHPEARGKERGAVSVSHAEVILGLETRNQKEAVARAVERHDLSVKETTQLVDVIKKDPWVNVHDAVQVVRLNASTKALNTLIVEFQDTRIARALADASEAAKIRPEEYAALKIVEGLVNDGHLSQSVLGQYETLTFVENGEGASSDSR
jgi:ParB/RepB/Spo0J family partition protein